MGNGADDERAGELMSEAQVMRELIRENDRLRADQERLLAANEASSQMHLDRLAQAMDEIERLRARVAELEANEVQLNGWIAHREQERDEAEERVAELEAERKAILDYVLPDFPDEPIAGLMSELKAWDAGLEENDKLRARVAELEAAPAAERERCAKIAELLKFPFVAEVIRRDASFDELSAPMKGSHEGSHD